MLEPRMARVSVIALRALADGSAGSAGGVHPASDINKRRRVPSVTPRPAPTRPEGWAEKKLKKGEGFRLWISRLTVNPGPSKHTKQNTETNHE